MQRSSVVFPDPLGPTMIRISPFSTWSETSWRTRERPNVFVSRSTRRIGIAASVIHEHTLLEQRRAARQDTDEHQIDQRDGGVDLEGRKRARDDELAGVGQLERRDRREQRRALRQR